MGEGNNWRIEFVDTVDDGTAGSILGSYLVDEQKFDDYHHEISGDLRGINDALQQMCGFKIGKWDDIIALIKAIGLTKKEWEYIKKKEDSGTLDEDDIKSLNEYFNDKE